jgi:alpha-L-rhamnosidase
MKLRFILAVLSGLLSFSAFASAVPKWITTADNKNAVSTWMCFQKEVDIPQLPKEAIARISADSKYWLWINGQQVVIEGGVKRGPNPKDSYYDTVNLLPYLHKGENLVSVMVWYYGKKGFSYNPSGIGALFIDCPELPAINTGDEWKGRVHPSFYVPAGAGPNYRLPESDIGFDARKDIKNWESKAQKWKSVKVVGQENDEPWGRLLDRMIPLWRDFGVKNYVSVERRAGNKADTIRGKLPYNCHVTPVITVNARAGKKIDIRTDNYMGGSAPNVYAEYITASGQQTYENPGWMNGEYVIYTVPKGVEVESVGYRETGYDTDFTGTFECSDDFLNRYRDKALRTLYVTMRDTYMDCPDRERAQWWGDEVNESGEAFYALSTSSHKLMKKGMYELIGWQRPDGSIYAPVPSSNWEKELPGQMLASVGKYGFWNYYLNTGDLETIADLYPGVKRYMSVWEKAPDGTMADRNGGWHWGDWGENIDKVALYNALYYLAQTGMRDMALALGNQAEADSISAEMSSLKEAFNRVFWTGKGYRHPDYKDLTDDRVQALAVVSGLADTDKYPAIFEIFKTIEQASPYMEKYVIEALFHMGEGRFGIDRMKRRFSKMTDNPDYSTLFEGWGIGKEGGFGGGTVNHAWSGGGLTLLSQKVCGIEPLTPGYQTFRVSPDLSGIEWVKTVVPTVKGNIGYEAHAVPGGVEFSFDVPEGTTAVAVAPKGMTIRGLNGEKVDGKSTLILPTRGRYTVTALETSSK